MFKLEIPKKYINMFEITELEEITIEVDSNFYKFNRNDFVVSLNPYGNLNSFWPVSWQKEVPEPQEDFVKNLILYYKKMGALSLIIKTTDGAIKVFHSMDGRKIIEVDRSLSTAVCNLESRLQHMQNNWGIVGWKLMDLHTYDTSVFDELNRYYIYSKNWLDDAGSSGGGNITSAITIEELSKRLGTLQIYEKVGPTNYRLTKQFIEGMERVI